MCLRVFSLFNIFIFFSFLLVSFSSHSAGYGEIQFTTSPKISEIFIDDEFKGRTPEKKGQNLSLKLKTGWHIVKAYAPKDKLSKAYKSMQIYVDKNEIRKIHLDLKAEMPSEEAERIDKLRNSLSRRNDFIINNDGTIYDKATNLTWSPCFSGQKYISGQCEGEVKNIYLYKAENLAAEIQLPKTRKWVVPTRWQLETLIHCSSFSQEPRDNKFDGGVTRCQGSYAQPVLVDGLFNTEYKGQVIWTSSKYRDKDYEMAFDRKAQLKDVIPSKNNETFSYVVNFFQGDLDFRSEYDTAVILLVSED